MNRILLFIFLFLSVSSLWATHNRAGEIRYEQIGELTIRATVVTYTRASSVDADRDSLLLLWGDGQSMVVGRSNGGGNGEEIGNDVKLNLYIAEHTYNGLGNYTLSMQDPNRNAGILNVNNPNSVVVPFYIETNFTLLSSQFQGFNRSVVLLQEPIDFGCTGQIFKHDPGAFDPDGDSLAYEFSVPMQAPGEEVPNYRDPDEVQPNSSVIDFDQRTGTFFWIVPTRAGLYNIAFRVNEYRNGVLIASTVRDMQIFIDACDNQAPVVSTEREFCVIAPEVLSFEVEADDPDEGQLVRLEAQGGPFVVEDPAMFLVDEGYQEPVLTGEFIWQTTCNHVRKEPYDVLFRGIDNFLDSTGLVDIQSVQIRVAAPPPQDVQAEGTSDHVLVSWESPYICEETNDDYFKGFSVWRRIGPEEYVPEPCIGGLPGTGYVRIASSLDMIEEERYVYRDFDVEAGVNYCYRVLADFALTTVNGNSFNRVSSLPSEETCVLFRQDIPVITNVSVVETDGANGEVDIRWILPDPDALDTMTNPGPYRLELWSASGLNPDPSTLTLVGGSQVTRPSFGALSGDTVFLHTTLNTVGQPYSYEVRFYAGDLTAPFSVSKMASSPFLAVEGTDRANILRVEVEVPWENTEYEFYLLEEATGDTVLLETTMRPTYRHNNLTNGEEYCYLVRTVGTYGVSEWKDPLFNWSQRACGIPIDNLAPCVPDLEVTNICDEDLGIADPEEIFNRITWGLALGMDCDFVDLDELRLYFAREEGGEFQFIASINPMASFYDHFLEDDLAGCYALTSVDFAGNESEFSVIGCVENCPVYTLPNVFTPNGDQANDLFRPFPYQFVDRIDLKIFNRWGQLVHETSDPDINWDGTNLNGEELAEGVYSYKLVVFERRTDGVIQTEAQAGFIHIVR